MLGPCMLRLWVKISCWCHTYTTTKSKEPYCCHWLRMFVTWNPTPHYFVLGSIMSSKGWLEVYYQALLREITGWVTPWKYTNYLLSKKKHLCLQSDASQCSTVSLLTFLQWLSMKSLMVCAPTVSILGKRLTEPLFSPNNEVIIRSPVYVLCASNLCL